MSIVLQSGDKYIGQDGSIIEDINLAIKFKSISSAKAYKENSLTDIAKQYSWNVGMIDEKLLTNAIKKEDTFVTQLELLKIRFLSCNFEKELCRSMATYLDKVIELLNSREKIKTLLSKYDKMLIDIQHYIELNVNSSINAEDVIGLQHRLLVKRRLCKNRLYTIEKIRSLGLKYFKNMISSFEGMTNRQYTNRYNKEDF